MTGAMPGTVRGEIAGYFKNGENDIKGTKSKG